MKKYKHAKDKKAYERVSFYIALSVCMMAVGLAVWSAYSTLSDRAQPESSYFSSLATQSAAVAQDMTGVTVAETQAPTEIPTEAPTQPPTRGPRALVISETRPPEADDDGADSGLDALQAVLRVEDSLIYPVRSRSVSKPYSEDSVYNKTMRDYRAHTGCDFYAEEGESVYAMCSGTVSDISVSELYGVIIEVDCGSFSVYYCGLDSDFMVDEGDEVTTGDTIALVGKIPCESEEEPHIHIEIRVGDRLIDPLSVIESDS